MIEHVWQRTQILEPVLDVIIATDSHLIKKECESFGATTMMTNSKHVNGLGRVGEVAKKLNWDFYIVLQSDEILVMPENLEILNSTIQKNKTYDFFNLITRIEALEDLNDQNIVKCIVRSNNPIMYFTRKSTSIASEEIQQKFTRKVCGVYAISSDALKKVDSADFTNLEISESIEQMKVIELELKALGVCIEKNYISVNTAQDAIKVMDILKKDDVQKNILRKVNQNEFI
jgi:3-deoxy-manno-octulosonate cytidylyltransferase (CMP-KDO synthetase)